MLSDIWILNMCLGWLFYLIGNAKPDVNLLGDSQRAPPWKCGVLRLGLHLQLRMGSVLTLPVQASPGRLFPPQILMTYSSQCQPAPGFHCKTATAGTSVPGDSPAQWGCSFHSGITPLRSVLIVWYFRCSSHRSCSSLWVL